MSTSQVPPTRHLLFPFYMSKGDLVVYCLSLPQYSGGKETEVQKNKRQKIKEIMVYSTRSYGLHNHESRTGDNTSQAFLPCN